MGPIFAGCAWVRRSRKKHPFPICIAKDAFALDTDEQIRVVITGHSFTGPRGLQRRNMLLRNPDQIPLFRTDVACFFGCRPTVR